MYSPSVKSLAVLALGTALFSRPSFAQIHTHGQESSGGGNGIVCFVDPADIRTIKANHGEIPTALTKGNHIRSIEVLDLYDLEANQLKSEIIPMKPDEAPDAYARRMLGRIQLEMPNLYKALKLSADDVLGDGSNVFRYDDGLKREDDANESIYVDNDCMIATIAKQTNFDGYSKLEIDNRLFNHPKNSQLSRGILYLHEALYRWARFHGHEVSDTVRPLVGLFTQKGMNYDNLIPPARNIIQTGTFVATMANTARQLNKPGSPRSIAFSPEYVKGLLADFRSYYFWSNDGGENIYFDTASMIAGYFVRTFPKGEGDAAFTGYWRSMADEILSNFDAVGAEIKSLAFPEISDEAMYQCLWDGYKGIMPDRLPSDLAWTLDASREKAYPNFIVNYLSNLEKTPSFFSGNYGDCVVSVMLPKALAQTQSDLAETQKNLAQEQANLPNLQSQLAGLKGIFNRKKRISVGYEVLLSESNIAGYQKKIVDLNSRIQVIRAPYDAFLNNRKESAQRIQSIVDQMVPIYEAAYSNHQKLINSLGINPKRACEYLAVTRRMMGSSLDCSSVPNGEEFPRY